MLVGRMRLEYCHMTLFSVQIRGEISYEIGFAVVSVR